MAHFVPLGFYRLQFQDWAFLKSQWSRFTDWYVNSPTHVIICGRAGYEYEFEPSLLVLMERHIDMDTKKAFRVATVLKDRSTAIDGAEVRNPTFADFIPHIKHLNLGGRQLGVDGATSDALIPGDDFNRASGPVQRRIVVDEIQSLLVLHIPGQSAPDKKRKVELLCEHFGASWVEIEEVMPLFDLRAGYDSLHRALEGKPSRYAAAQPAG
jgi:hypothetical protein